MSARDVICNAASDCQSVVIRGDVYELTDAILAALAAAGYVIVPREPTEAMVEAFSRVRPAHYFPLRKWADDTKAAIRAAILAALEQKK